jgi:RNA recognition motif-containing protein
MMDLQSGISEAELEEMFRDIGVEATGISIKPSVGGRPDSDAAFVTFDSPETARYVIGQLNYRKCAGVTIHIVLWDEETRTIIKSKKGNLFVKGFDPSIGDASLHQVFSHHGDIVSLIIPRDESGVPQSYAFVQFRNPLHADRAIRALHGVRHPEVGGPLVVQIAFNRHH